MVTPKRHVIVWWFGFFGGLTVGIVYILAWILSFFGLPIAHQTDFGVGIAILLALCAGLMATASGPPKT